MRKFSAILMVLCCFLTVSCSNLFEDKGTEKGSITITMPSCRTGSSNSRAAEEEPFPDNHFWIALNRGEDFVQGETIAAGESFTFDGIEPGVYNLYGWGLVDGLAYEGTQADIVVEAGKVAEATLTLKIMDFNNPKILVFTYEANKPEFNRYLSNINKKLLATPFKKNSIVKVTVSGIPSEDFNGEMKYFYGGLVDGKDDAWEDLENMNPVSVKANRKKGERYTDTFTFMVTGEPKEGYIPWLGVWYSADAMNKPMKVTDVQFSYEYVDECLPDFITAKSTSKGVELTVKRPAGVTAWNSMEFKTKDSKMYMTPMGQDDSEEFTVTWPFVSSGEAYIFDFGANFNNEWAMYKCAVVYKGTDTGLSINEPLVEKLEQSRATIDSDYNLKLETDIAPSDFTKFANFPSPKIAYQGNLYGGKLYEQWADWFYSEDMVNLFAGTQNLISSGLLNICGNQPFVFISRLNGYSTYTVDLRLELISDDYPSQAFCLPGFFVEDCPITNPKEFTINKDLGGCFISDGALIGSVAQGEYLYVNISGLLEYDATAANDTILKACIYDAVAGTILAPEVKISSSIPSRDTPFENNYGFYISEASEKAMLRLKFVNDSDESLTELKVKNYECTTAITPVMGGTSVIRMLGSGSATSDLKIYLPVGTIAMNTPFTLSGKGSGSGNASLAFVTCGYDGVFIREMTEVDILKRDPSTGNWSSGPTWSISDITATTSYRIGELDAAITSTDKKYLCLTFDPTITQTDFVITDFSYTYGE